MTSSNYVIPPTTTTFSHILDALREKNPSCVISCVSDDKSLASINKKLSDIVEKKGNVNEQLNSMLYQLTNAEVAVEETNRNRVIENIILIKGLY